VKFIIQKGEVAVESQLFSPIEFGGLTLPNRIIVSPMCQFSAEDGSATDWHLVHLGTLSLSGAGLLVLEASGVSSHGRITLNCLGLYSDENEAALAPILARVRGLSDMKIGIQIGHAGRKASTAVPWKGRGPLAPDQGGWETVAPSAIPFADGWPVPHALTRDEMTAIRDDFVSTAGRALRMEFDYLEVHAAHGYLLSTFLTEASNQRDDEFGGSLENRMRYPLEVIGAVRDAWPKGRPLGVKFNGTDFLDGGWGAEESVAFAGALKEAGVDVVTISGGGIDPGAKINVVPGYQVPFAKAVREGTGITTTAVGMIYDPHQAEAIIAQGEADMVALARAFLFNPHWPYHAAAALGEDVPWPPQYERGSPKLWGPGADCVAAPLSKDG